MKKLMFAAAAVAVTGGVFAQPLVYDYKASVKHMYLKLNENVKAYDGVKYSIYTKFQKSATLKGFLIMDQDGVTSPIVSATTGKAASTGTGFDYGRERGFLVVQNTNLSAESKFLNKQPKSIPAVLDAKYMDTNFKKATMPTTGLAEGYLYLGGDTVACVRTFIDNLAGTLTDRGAAPAAPAAGTPGMSAIADYVWTSVFLFGRYNGPNWYYDPIAAAGPFDNFETAWDANLPVDLQIGFVAGHPYFHDTWMNGSGFGKYTVPSKTTGGLCCGLKATTVSTIILESLCGSVKGGLFLCTENAIDAVADVYDFFDGDYVRWEDQFNTARLVPGVTFADGFQNDMWNDGPLEMETSDIITGSWSIKYNAKFFSGSKPIYKALTLNEIVAINAAATAGTEAVQGLEALTGAIKGAALNLYPKANIVDGTELHAMSASTFMQYVGGTAVPPLLTPQFAKYYGLADWN